MTEREIFIAALQKEDPDQRRVYLDEVCAQAPELRGQVESLLRLYQGAGSFLEKPAVESAAPATLAQPILERPGIQIGPYKLMEQIGEGGMGLVFVAEQHEPVRRKVALKVIKPGMDTRDVIARFEAERRALALMDHPSIARVLDAGTTSSGRPYFVMELVKGVPITQYCDDNRVAPRERLELFVQVCHAVQHAHQKGIIHRDIKPTNVLVASHDGTPVVKVIDFGVAKAIGARLTEKTIYTQFTQMVGTPLYMSPEQAGQSSLDIDTRTDIYALGVILYELLTATTPFDKERLGTAGYDEVRRIIRDEEPAKPSTRISTLGLAAATVSANRGSDPRRLKRLVRGELDWVVMKALEKDRNRRYETASAFAADVQRYLDDQPVEACPPSALYRFRKFARRNRAVLATGFMVALAVLLTVAGLATSTFLISHQQQVTQKALQAEIRSKGELKQALDRERDVLKLQRSQSYRQLIALAQSEWLANNLSRMEALLEQCPADLRGGEWHYLKRLRYGAQQPLRHESPVYSVEFSLDGQYLAAATKDGFIRLWQAKTAQQLQEWQAHQNNATAVSFSHDSRYLATGSWDGTVKLWDVEKLVDGHVDEPLLRWEYDTRVRVWSVAFSPDGRRLASAGGRTRDEKGEVKVWDLSSRQEVLTLSNFSDSVRRLKFSHDGRRLATAGPGLVQIWDVQTGQEQFNYHGHNDRVEDLAFSPDGRRLASVGGLLSVYPDEEVKVWDTETGRELLSLRGHVGGLRAVAYSPDGRRLASAGLDQTVKIWDAATGQEVLTLRGHIDNVFCLAFSPDGHQLVSGSVDHTIRIWDATPLERETTAENMTLIGHTGAVTDVAFHPDGRSLATAGADGTVRIWDAWSGKVLRMLGGRPSSDGLKVAYSPDGRRLAVANGTPGRPVRVWEIATQKEICNFPHHVDGARCVAFDPSGLRIASAGFDFAVRVWDAETGEEVRAFEDHNWPVFGVAFSPDGRHLASGSADSTVAIWDWITGEQPVLRIQHAGRVRSVAFSRDGTRLASASWDRTIKIFEAESWKLIHDLPDPTGAVECVAFGDDRRRITWGSTDSTVKVWDGPGTETHVLRGHTSWIQAVAFSTDGNWIASASLDGTVKIWQAPPRPRAPTPEAAEPGNEATVQPAEV